jgi:glutamyl-tRNA(Gln) amidotransferase subunit D
MELVRITATHGTYEGVRLPSHGTNVVLKLKSGYNIGIHRDHISKEESLGTRESAPTKPKTVVQSDAPLVIILHLGGTIAAKVDYATGATVAQFDPEELLSMFPELQSEARIESTLVRNMQSDHMQPGHYNVIADAITEALKKKPKGIVISHGTDTMQYSAAALSFILEGCPIPVVLVGAQRSSDRGSSDAAMNLIAAVHFCVQTSWRGVGVCMHKTIDDTTCWILPGTNVGKLHSARRDAFRPVNRLQVADIDVPSRTITYVDATPAPEMPFRVRHFDPALKVGLVKLHPGIRHEELAYFARYDALVLEGTGLGHAPIEVLDEETKENGPIWETIQKLAASIPVAMTTQCVYGRVSLQVYSPGRMLQDAGVLGHDCDMPSWTAYMKLWWLLSNERDNLKELYTTNLRGELTAKTHPDAFLR